MTKLERRIAAVAEATRKTVVIGRQGHKDEWFANVDGIESGGSTALAALESVVHGLQKRAASDASAATAAVKRAEALRAL